MACFVKARVPSTGSRYEGGCGRTKASKGFWLRPIPPNPAYNKYRTPEQVKESSAEHYWRIANVERETGATILSCIAWIPGFLKYYVVPYPIKFLFMLLWLPVRHVLFNVHKRVVVQCCKVDAFFSGKPKDIFKTTHGAQTRFDRAVFLQRLHGERNLLQDLWYWANLAVRRNK